MGDTMCGEIAANGSESRQAILKQMADAETRAWRALGQYKFMMAGYWMAMWVHLNQIGKFKQPNPFRPAVILAREMTEDSEREAVSMLRRLTRGGTA